MNDLKWIIAFSDSISSDLCVYIYIYIYIYIGLNDLFHNKKVGLM